MKDIERADLLHKIEQVKMLKKLAKQKYELLEKEHKELEKEFKEKYG